MRSLILILLALPVMAHAVGMPKTCPLKSQQLRLARECFTGDMRSQEDIGIFLGTEENAKSDLNFCYNAFVVMYPRKGGELQLTVMKDNERGQLRIYNYATMAQSLAPAGKGRQPASKQPLNVSFKNLKAECYNNRENTDSCSKGIFGIGSTDLPLTLELARGRGGLNVKGTATDPNAVKAAFEKALVPKGEGDVAQTDLWLLQVIKQRLLTNAQQKLAMISARKIKPNKIGEATTQFRYCRMALEGFVHQRKMIDPFTEKERKLLDSLEGHLKTTAPAVPK